MSAYETDPATGLPIGLEVDATPAKLPERVTLRGRHMTVAPLDPEAHAEALFEAAHGSENDRLWLYLFDGPFTDLASFRANIEKKAATNDPFFYALLDAGTGQPLGHAALMRIAPADRCIEVGSILYAPALQRTPAATEAMYLLARYVFEDLGYRRYEWKCNALNGPSHRAALRLGFTYEGTFRQHMIVKGRNRDTAWFSMLDSEWPARKAAFERWLDPANFDEQGHQKESLSALNGQKEVELTSAPSPPWRGEGSPWIQAHFQPDTYATTLLASASGGMLAKQPGSPATVGGVSCWNPRAHG